MLARARSPYVPEAGDVIWLNFDPQAGREQAGRRQAALVARVPEATLAKIRARLRPLMEY